MKRAYKAELAARLSKHLERFRPDLAGQFICPTCLNPPIPLSSLSEISEAHIIPKAAGGGISTLICRRCNSLFGTKQDKWFGEHVRLHREGKDVLQTRITTGDFTVDGVRYGGTFLADREHGVDFLIDSSRCSPEALDELRRQKGRAKATITVPLPLLANESLLRVGFLTAAYLLWFQQLGYSWALQKHLDAVREQIRNPDRPGVAERSILHCFGRSFDPPWIGVVRYNGEVALIAAIGDRLIGLPTFDRPTQTLADLGVVDGQKADVRQLLLYRDHAFGGPVGIVFENRMLVMPDVIRADQTRGSLIGYRSWDSAAESMRFISVKARLN